MSGAEFAPLVLLGRCSDERAELLVVDRGPAGAVPGARIEGRLTGPRCRHAAMLPVDAPLEPLAPIPGGVALARCILTEPAYWQPDVPALYRLEARLLIDGREAAGAVITVGLRRGGVRGGSLWLEGRRYVPRGVRCTGLTATAVDELRGSMAAAWIDDPDDASLTLAASAGVAIVARLPSADRDALAARLVDLAACPAVILASFAMDTPAAEVTATLALVGKRRGALPVGLEVDGGLAPPAAGLARVDALVVLIPDAAVVDDGWLGPWPAARLAATARGVAGGSIADGRRACDRLQARLAAAGATPWAGYLVG